MSFVRFAPMAFTVVFCAAYGVIFAMDWPLFLYYPLHGDLVWGHETLQGAGPGMAWYGLLASAGLIALPAAVILPDRMVDRVLRDYVWLFPVAAMLVCIYLLRDFFA